jgi:carboxylate-amine ligase
VEIEYALVRRGDLRVAPEADALLTDLGGSPDAHPALGNVEADNELAAHVLELKSRAPGADLAAQAGDFQAFVRFANRALAKRGLRLMPGGMHPFMDPAVESRLWSHEDNRVYAAYDRVFGCRGHGWLNIQSVHLNLPFTGDVEFSRLHNAVSLLLPLLPALAAASPVYGGAYREWLDGRLFHYIANQKRLPSIIGPIIPEPVGGEQEYRDKILAPMFREIAPLDPEEVLQEEWLNSRAAIARFDRGSIEIRCMDTQEHPGADLALCQFAASALRLSVADGGDLLALHKRLPASALRSLFLETARIGMAASMPAAFPFSAFGLDPQPTAGDTLRALAEKLDRHDKSNGWTHFSPTISLMLTRGNLAERILKAASPGAPASGPKPERYPGIYAQLCDCLEAGEAFL